MVGDSYRWDYQSAQDKGVDAVLINSDYHQEAKHAEPARLLIDDLDGLLPLLGLA
jgi:phosphoglycolate phosphatase-like HAD superfamily hydrolase